MSRRETLVVMLRRFEEAQSPAFRRDTDGRGGGNSLALMPRTWNRSFRELERCLKELRASEPVLYRHLKGRFLDPWRMRIVVPVKYERSGELRVPAGCELVAGGASVGAKQVEVVVSVWARWVDERQVGRALDALEGLFVGEPFLPEEFRAA